MQGIVGSMYGEQDAVDTDAMHGDEQDAEDEGNWQWYIQRVRCTECRWNAWG